VASDAVVVVDEFSMTSLEDAKAILERIDARPNACVQYLGGGAQLENISPGNTHRVLTEASDAHGHHRELTEVFRQQGPSVAWMRDAMPALDKAILDADQGCVRQGFRQFDSHGHVKYHENRKDEIAGKAEDIVAGYQRGYKVIAPGVDNTDAKYVNRAVRHKLGHVGQGVLYQLEHRKREFSPGERIVFTKNAERLYGVLNAYCGDVVAVAPNAITVHLDGGRVVEVDPRKYPHLEWGFAVTTHKSQGQGDPIAVVSITKSDTARTAYVALTRCTEWLHAHTRMKPEGTQPPEKRQEEVVC
jgi:ATP-dependent exoDNAse (exonuclease V) alpha subunit